MNGCRYHFCYFCLKDETFDMIYQWRAVIDEYQRQHKGETKILMSEAYGNETIFVKYYQSPDGFRQGSHMPFNFVLITDLNTNSTAADFKRVIDDRIKALPKSKKTNWVIGNHDQPRMASRYGSEKVDALLTLLMTLPGIAVTYNVRIFCIVLAISLRSYIIFQGEEIGMVDYRYGISFEETLDPAALNAYPDGPRDGWEWKSRDPERTPFQWDDTNFAGFCECKDKTWLPVNDNYPDLNLARQKSLRKSTFNYYKELSELRKDETMMKGDYKSFVKNQVLGYTRLGYNEKESYFTTKFLIISFYRSLTGHGPRLILINFGDTDEVVNVSKFTNLFGQKLRVLVAGGETSHGKGYVVWVLRLHLNFFFSIFSDILNANNVRLGKFNAIVVENSTAHKTTLLISIVLDILKLLKN